MKTGIVASWLLASAQVFAQQAGNDVTVALDASRIVAHAQGESRADAASAKPGDVIEYRAVYRNAGRSAARAVSATLPIPAGTEYVASSASPRLALRASLDGKRYDPVPLMRRVKRADGQTVEQPVPLAEYRFLRWDLGDLAPQKDSTVSARVRVQAGDVIAAAAAGK